MSAEYSSQGAQRYRAEGTQVFSIPDGVQIFHITKEGYVSAPSYPTSMHIVKLDEAMEGDEDSRIASDAPPAFIQVGDWIYPLVPGTSPVLHTTYHAYLFPDLSPEAAGSSVGLLLPDTVTQEERHMLGDVLRNLSAVHEQQITLQPEDLAIPSAPQELPEATAPPMPQVRPEEQQVPATEQSTSEKISHGIIVASKWISWGVGKGAEKAGELISHGSNKLREKLKPETEAKPVDPRVQKGMVYARNATHVAVSVSGYVVNKLGAATMALGRKVGPPLLKKGQQYLPKSMKTEKGKSKMDGVIEVAASGLQGFGTVFMSLEGAAKALAKSLANETVTTVHHKYGEHAGKLTENIVYSTGNVAMFAYNADNLGIKAIAKRAAKDTGKAVIEDMSEKRIGAKQSHGACVDGGYNEEKKDRQPPL
ncbi:spartin-like isoform X2 [Littorina saxatilis]